MLWDQGVRNFPLVIWQEVNVITRLEFEIIYNDIKIQLVNHDVAETSLLIEFLRNNKRHKQNKKM